MNRSVCVSCDRSRTQRADGRSRGGRGLCRVCYELHHRHGDLDQFPRVTRTADEVLDEWVFFRNEGHTVADVANRLGMRYDTFRRALIRAHQAGDPRATGFGYQGQVAA